MKKRLFSIFVVLCMVVTMIPAMSITATAKTVDPDTSWYNVNDKSFILDSKAKFLGFAKLVNDGKSFKGQTVKLTTDVYLNGISWTPIADTFAGTFDGCGNTISNVTVNVKTKCAGLFAGITETARIINLNLTFASIKTSKSSAYVGGIVGYNKGEIYNSGIFNNSSVSSTGVNGQAGGIVGHNAGTIVNCYFVGSVNSKCKSGGIVGAIEYKSDAKIANCYSAGAKLKGGIKGGIVGGTNGCDLSYCYYEDDNASYGSANYKNNKNTYKMPDVQMSATTGNPQDSNKKWITSPLNQSHKDPLVDMLNDYVKKYNDEYGGILLDWEFTKNVFPTLKYGVITSNTESTTTSGKPCIYLTRFPSYAPSLIDMVLCDEEVGMVYPYHDYDLNAYVIKQGEMYIALTDDFSEVVLQSAPYPWRIQNDGSIYHYEAITTGSGKKTQIISKTIYLAYNDGKFIPSEELVYAWSKNVDQSHTLAYKDNNDEKTHTVYCSKCGTILREENHGGTGTCICGHH